MNKSENEFEDEELRCRFVENAVHVVELHPNCARCQKLSVSARAVMRCPFQPTNRAVWKMEGARRSCIVVVVSRRVRWLRPAVCNGDFAIAIAHMHADRDGDVRWAAWCDSHAG